MATNVFFCAFGALGWIGTAGANNGDGHGYSDYETGGTDDTLVLIGKHGRRS